MEQAGRHPFAIGLRGQQEGPAAVEQGALRLRAVFELFEQREGFAQVEGLGEEVGGEGSGAVAAVPLVQAAAAMASRMATLAELMG